MKPIVSLYSMDDSEIENFLKAFFEENIEVKDKLHWEKSYDNPIEIASIIGVFIDNQDKYKINMWISLDTGIFINVTKTNADNIIRYLYERYPN